MKNRYYPKMLNSYDAVKNVLTLGKARAMARESAAAISKHEYIIKMENIKILAYKKRIRLLEEKFPNDNVL